MKSLKILALLVALSVVCVSCGTIENWFGLEEDNFIEELAEDIVRMETGLDLDFTPCSPEK